MELTHACSIINSKAMKKPKNVSSFPVEEVLKLEDLKFTRENLPLQCFKQLLKNVYEAWAIKDLQQLSNENGKLVC